MATKYCYKVLSRVLKLDEKLLFLILINDQLKMQKSNDTNDYVGSKTKIKAKYYSKIEYRHNKICELITDKLKCYFKEVDLQELLFFNFFDGINHLETMKGKVDLISFLSICTNKYLLNLFSYLTSRSISILTWQELAVKEEPYAL